MMPHDSFHTTGKTKRIKKHKQESRHPNARTALNENIEKYTSAKVGWDEEIAKKVDTLKKLIRGGKSGDFGIHLIRLRSLPCGARRFTSIEKAVNATVPTLCIRITVPAGYGTPPEEKRPGWRLAGYLLHQARELATNKPSIFSRLLDVRKLIIEVVDGLQHVHEEFPVPTSQRV